jgi:alkyldihydroxyacetonephosphate synthase
MTITRNLLRWNGWGWLDGPDILAENAEAIWRWMGDTFSAGALPDTPATALEDTTLPDSALGDDARNALTAIIAPGRIKTDAFERAFHARGRSYADCIELRSGNLSCAPDAVVYPESAEECLALLRFAEAENLAIVPFGGGSSVVGGVNTLPSIGQRGTLTLDLTRMNRLIEIDETSLIAHAEAGIYGPALEEQLQARGYTLGHYPQSFEFSTLGGWIATRGAGHQSNKYGKAEKWFAGAEVVSPGGVHWCAPSFPGSAAGPQWRDIVAGSEGALGIITSAKVHIHPVPEVKDYRAYLFMDWGQAVTAVRALMQRGVPTAMIRLSDPDETYFFGALKSGGAGMDPSVRVCIMLVGLEGAADPVAHARASSQAIIEEHGGAHMGSELGDSWYRHRFETPYLRDPMLDRGLGVDTLETCASWSKLMPLYEAVSATIREALAARPGIEGGKGVCMAHISHCYRDGASLYFTFAFARDPGDPLGQWQHIKSAASECILANGGTITHHHGVGTDHKPWYHREVGVPALEGFRALKRSFDPNGVLNPGKLWD